MSRGCGGTRASRCRRTLDYAAIGGLSASCGASSSAVRPGTLAQAARIEGMTPAALTLILMRARQRAGRARVVTSAPRRSSGASMFHVKQWQRLEAHLDLLARWNPRINLVSRVDPRRRLDAGTSPTPPSSGALRPPGARLWLDLGSGAGFPGLVIAALAAEAAPELEVRLVESDQRKAAFLARRRPGRRAARRRCSTRRIEDLPPQAADVVSARALAPLDDAARHGGKTPPAGGYWLVSQGRDGA